jgi:hypothetical protein
MFYTRSSFIRYLTGKRNCEIINCNDRKDRVITFRNVPFTGYLVTGSIDIIDYEEIAFACRKLRIDLPGDSDLERWIE